MLNEINETLKRALALASTNPREALDVLEGGLVTARASDDRHGVSLLAKHAGTVCAGTGDLAQARMYYAEALTNEPADALLHFAQGDLCRRLGEQDAARRAFARSAELAIEQGNAELAGMASNAGNGLDDT